MIEILGIWLLARKIGAMVEEKGYKKGRYQFMVVVFWIGGEILGSFLGVIATHGDRCTIYTVALLGALLGAFITYMIVLQLPVMPISLTSMPDPVAVPAAQPVPKPAGLHTGQLLDEGTEYEPPMLIDTEQLSICPNCHLLVLPKPNGTCPGCQAMVVI